MRGELGKEENFWYKINIDFDNTPKVKEAPPIQEPPVQETDAPGKTQEPAVPGTNPALYPEQSVIPGIGEDNPIRFWGSSG